MINEVYINYLDYYIPDDYLEIKDIYGELTQQQQDTFKSPAEFMSLAAKYFQSDKISLEKNKSIQDMLILVLDKLINTYSFDKNLVRYVFLCGEYDGNLENFGHELLHNYKFLNSNTSFVRGNYCANIEIGMELAFNVLKNTADEAYILLITGDKIQDIAARIVGTYGILGDAAGIVLLSNKRDKNVFRIKDTAIVSDGSLYKIDMFKDNTPAYYKGYKKAFEKTLSKNQLSLNEINYIVLPNANTILTEFVLKSIDKSVNVSEKIVTNKQLGHLDTIDVIVNIKSLENKISNRDKVVTLGLGAAGTFTSLYLEYLTD